MILFFKRLFQNISPQDKDLATAVRSIVGYRPYNINLFRLAMQHSSLAKENKEGHRESNERLEFLGDAVLGMVVAGYLFKKYPYKDEGFLTEIRSRIVNRESLNGLAMKLGVNKIIEYYQDKSARRTYKSIYGNALEALIGAVYLDRGYSYCKKFILNKLLVPHYDLEEVIRSNRNFKSTVIEWAQKESKEVAFEIMETVGDNRYKEFTARLLLNDKFISEGNGPSKKKAEQDAAMRGAEILKIVEA